MTRLTLAFLLLAPLAAFGQVSSPFSVYVHDTTGKLPDAVLPSAYQLPATPMGGFNATVLKLINTSQSTVQFVLALVSTGANSTVTNPNFSVTGQSQNLVLAPGGSVLFTVDFAPTTTGIIPGYLNVAYQIQQNGCLFSNPNPVLTCPGNLANVSILTGTATAAQLTLSYTAADGSSVVLQPTNSLPLNFPNTSLNATSTITFTLANPTSTDTATPAILLPPVNSSPPLAFALNTSGLPAVIRAGQSANFSVSFAPSQTGLASAILEVNSNTYALQGAGIIIATVDSLQISYADSTGVRTLPQSSIPISFGQIALGGGASAVLTFSVSNPVTSYNAVTISGISIAGASFSLSSVPAVPISIVPGNSITFNATFAPSSAGSFSGTLTVGSRQFSVTGAALSPSPLSFYLADVTGAPKGVLPAAFQLPSTPVGGASPIVLKATNTSTNPVEFVLALVSAVANSSTKSPNFSVTGQFQDLTVAPGNSVLFTVNFTPTTIGAVSGFLNIAFQIQQNGCVLSGTDPSTACPANISTISVLGGTATAPQISLSYTAADGSSIVLQPGSNSPLNFPNTSLSTTSTINFTLANPTSIDATAPAISLPPVNSSAPLAFALNASNVPATIKAGQSATFSVVFAPSQTGLTSGVLQVGSNTYPIQGAGIIVASIDSLQISYTDATGVRTLPQSATPISFSQVVPGGGASAVLTFSVTNPTTSYSPVTVPAVTVSGLSFSLSGAPTAPASIAPGDTITFKVAFTPVSVGTYTGNLAIGARTFVLNGLSVTSPLPAFSLVLSGPLSSQQQDTVTIQFAAPAAVSALGTISLQFVPLANLVDDPAIMFLTNASRQLSVSVAAGAQNAAYKDKSGNAQSAIAFQTGTTGGTVTFSVAFANTATYTQSFAIPSAAVQLTSAQALRQSPNLLVTVHGYDNTYSAGQLSFTFYDTTGKVIGSPLQVNAASNFQQLFFNNNTAGGVFSLQGSFPVTGDVNQVGSVAIGVTSSLGQATTTATFQ